MSINTTSYGGYGNGGLGTVAISDKSTTINLYASVTNISNDGKTLTIANATGTFTVGMEIIFHVTTTDASHTASYGLYSFARIASISGTTYTLDTAAVVTDITGLTCQIVSVPNYNNLTVSAQIKPLTYDATKKIGGIIIAKANDTADFTSGGLITEGSAASLSKPSGLVFSNDDLKTKLPMNVGNGIEARYR